MALALLAGRDASVCAQAPATPPGELPPCPTNAASPTDPKQPCLGSGSAGGASGPSAVVGSAPSSGGASGGSGSAPNPTPEVLGPYRVVKVMDRAGEKVDGVVCAIDKPFVVHMETRPATFDIVFEPADKAHGGWTYAYDIPRAGETHKASGEHTVSPAAADGARSLTIDGKDLVAFKGFAGPMPMHYVMGLMPIAAGSGCGR